MKKILIIILISSVIVITFNHKNIIQYFLGKEIKKITKLDAKFEIEKLNLFDGQLVFKDISLFDKKNKNEIFNISLLDINFSFKSIFTDLVIIYEVNILNPKFFFQIKEEIDNKEQLTDNLDLVKKLSEDKKKIYPPKKRDKNFIIYKLKFKNAITNLKYPLSKNTFSINLSDMNFSQVGNIDEKKAQHYKDIFGIILKDIYFRVSDQKLKEFLKQNYFK